MCVCMHVCVCVCVWREREGDWRRLLKVPWTSRRSNQSILKQINPEYEGLNLKLKTESETSIFRQPDKKSQLIGKDPNDEKNWRQEEKGMIEDEMVGWHYRLNRYEFEQAPGDGEGQESLACSSPWGHKESDMTKWLNWTDIYIYIFVCVG